jgi:small nuclear ribonucleoprotein D3
MSVSSRNEVLLTLPTINKAAKRREIILQVIIINYNLMSIGVPIKLLHEAELHVVTVELKTGELYRGYLMEAEDTMNMRLDDVFVTKRDGKQLHFDQVFVRGSQVRFIVIPDMLKNSPMFKRISN